MIFDRRIIKSCKEDKNFMPIDKPFFFKLLNEICTISEQEDFVKNELITEQDIIYVIEFDRQHERLLEIYPQDKLLNYIETAIKLYRSCEISSEINAKGEKTCSMN